MWDRTAVALVATLLLAALGWIVFRGQNLSRSLLVDRFSARIEEAGRFIVRFVEDRHRNEERIATSRFAGRVDHERFELAVEALGFEAAVLLDSRGRLLAVYPPEPALLGTEIASRYEHLSAAVRGEHAVSDVVPSAARGFPVVAMAAPFDTPTGRRVFSGAFSVEVGPLGSFLQEMLPFQTSRVYLVDGAGNIAASSETPRKGIDPLSGTEPDLARLVSRDGTIVRTRGRGSVDGVSSMYMSIPIGSTRWHLVTRVTEAELFAPVARGVWPQWMVFAGLVTAAVVALHLLRRLTDSRRMLQERIIERERLSAALDEFTSRAAHDLRSPLATIRMAADLLEEPSLRPEQRQAAVGSVKERASQAMVLIEELLELARASGTARPENLDVGELVGYLRDACPDAEIVTHGLPAVVFADRVTFRQALLNLVRNAVTHADPNGKPRVDIEAQRVDDHLVFAVADRGPGVPADSRETVFAPFERGRGAHRDGSGLGLAIVRAAAEAHGGRAWYEDRPGGGACFKISVPLSG